MFLASHPRAGIRGGDDWERALYVQLHKADVLIFLGTDAAVRSCWCHTELAIGRSLGLSIVPVLLNGDVTHPLLGNVQGVRLGTNGAGLRPIVDAIARIGVTPLDTLPWDPGLPPYPGLRAFDERLAGVFYGREPERDALLERLRLPLTDPAERLTMVVGASGSGKPSLVRAGVVPRVRRLPGWIVVPPFKPEDDPIGAWRRRCARPAPRRAAAERWSATRPPWRTPSATCSPPARTPATS